MAAVLRRDQKEPDKLEGGNLALVALLQRNRLRAARGETARTSRDRRGSQLFNYQMWSGTLPTSKFPITCPTHIALFDRVTGLVTKYEPVPKVEPVNGADEDGARILQGAILTSYRENGMQELVKIAYRQAGYTRPCMFYSYWDHTKLRGLGFPTTEIIPGYRSIIDDTKYRLVDMDFCGFKVRRTRAKLMQICPDKADEIATASEIEQNEPLSERGSDNPLKWVPNINPQSQDLQYSTDHGLTYSGIRAVKTRKGTRESDPLAAEVDVEFQWLRDETPIKVQRPKLDAFGRQLYRIATDEEGNPSYEITGYKVVQTMFGPVNMPEFKPKRVAVLEEQVEKKYKQWRCVVWIPQDEVILRDLDWDAPLPLQSVRDRLPIDGYWSQGTVQMCETLAVAKNILYTIIFQRFRVSLMGTFLATPQSGLKKNKLSPEDGAVFYAKKIDSDNIKQFPAQPLDASQFQLIHEINSEMLNLFGISDPMQGQAAGRAESPQTYDRLIEQGGTSIVDRAQSLARTLEEWAEYQMWMFQHFGGPEHMIQMETPDGNSAWKALNPLLIRGQYACDIEAQSMIAYSEMAQYERAKESYAQGIYAKPMFVKAGRIPYGRQALEEVGRLLKDPSKQYLLGAASAPPPKPATAKVGGSGGKSNRSSR